MERFRGEIIEKRAGKMHCGGNKTGLMGENDLYASGSFLLLARRDQSNVDSREGGNCASKVGEGNAADGFGRLTWHVGEQTTIL